jgi:DNA-binding response OmpR family regulator
MTRILLVDDDRSLHELLGEYLQQRDYVMLHANDGRECLKIIFEKRPDLVILDVMMPNMDGWRTLERIREMSDLPVILLTARDAEHEKLKGFRLGSDDYITKPFSFAVLAARIEAILKRISGKRPEVDILQVGRITLDVTRHLVTRDETPIELTPTEFKLLKVLMCSPGRVFTQEQLVTRIWGEDYMEETGYIRRYIWHLRRKIEVDPNNSLYIHNERGIGYKFEWHGEDES